MNATQNDSRYEVVISIEIENGEHLVSTIASFATIAKAIKFVNTFDRNVYIGPVLAVWVNDASSNRGEIVYEG